MIDTLKLDPQKKYPITLPNGEEHQLTVYLANVIDHPRMDIGICSYYNSFLPVTDYAREIAPYLFPFSPEKVIIGKFCQFAHGTRLITTSANHPHEQGSSYPFDVFHPSSLLSYSSSLAPKGDSVIGHDVWIGMDAVIMPGVRIGNGAIIGTRSVVTHDVPAYSIWAGNPAQQIKKRFPEEVIQHLQRLCWWDWPIELISRYHKAIAANDFQVLDTVKA